MNDTELALPAFSTLLLSESGQGIYTLELNRPKQLNAIDSTMLNELMEAIRYLQGASDVRVLLLTGAGEKAFAAGADISQMSGLAALEARHFSQLGNEVFAALERLPFATIALVNGFALGGGCELALSCDFILASDKARFGQPEVTLGVPPGFGGSQRLTRLVGRGMAMELLLSGRMVDATEAVRIGLANHAYAAESLREEGMKLAQKIAANGPVAVRLTKELAHRGPQLDLTAACALESDLFALAFATEDQKEGMTAFLEKRPAAFKGR
ncbi:enoyl-CoA hydratase-related protein [Pokkaliibacter sp. MBI-7]|uniref:enoyl-CoA hydratase-related protein n=1 Tax=Pokkaliibacter sp. MBI-7 TaxID=3040600 RepID=UPI002447AA4A|nr:enoyl-CoA hydratase-related protein [Pokkaliibacter sp. MBI-7]MDH2435222.1 enoyl-CoA hydratase-related protein [Pokkaliibacter sp. MBI-7]